MTVIRNERDKLLQSALHRALNPPSALLLLMADPTMFEVDVEGNGSPAKIDFTAVLYGLTGGALVFTVTGGTISRVGNVATLLYADMPGDTAEVTATLTINGEVFTAKRTVYKHRLETPDTLKEALNDVLTIDQLSAALRTRIELIDATAEVAGSVAALIKAETDARIADIEQEINDRITAIQGEAQAREAYVQDYTFSKVETNNALAIQATMIRTAYEAYADAAKTSAISTASADVRNYAYSKTNSDAAEAAQTNSLTTAYQTYATGKRDEALTAAAADVRSYAYSKAASDGSIASLASTLRAEMASNGGASEAYVQQYAYSKAQVDSSQAGLSSTLTTGYKGYADAIVVGGRNLYSRTTSLVDIQGGATVPGRSTSGFTIRGINANTGVIRMYNIIPKNGTFTISFDLMVGLANGYPLMLDFCDGTTGAQAPWTIIPTTAVQHFSRTFDIGNYTSATYNFIDFNQLSGQDYIFTNFKVEVGHKETGWSPSPEDVAADIVGAQTAAITTSAADIRNYAYAKSTVDGSFATQFSTLTTNYQNYANTARDVAVSIASADVRNYAYSKADTVSTIASQTSTLSTTVGNHTTSIQSHTESINGIGGQLVFKIDNNGHVSGMGLASTTVNGVPTSAVVFNVDALEIATPGGASKKLITVGTRNGATAIGLGEVNILDDAITARAIDVVNLSAVSAVIGELQTATSGQRTRIKDNAIRLYDNYNNVIMLMGDSSVS